MKTAMQELIEIIYERPTEISQFNAFQLLKLIEPLLERKEIMFDLICFIRTNDKMGKSVEDLYNEFYNQKNNL